MEVFVAQPVDISTEEYAQQCDEHDALRHLRKHFIIPTKDDLVRTTLGIEDGSHSDTAESSVTAEPSVYLCGNSLGLQPKLTQTYMQQYLDTWATKGVYGHFKQMKDSNLAPWLHVDSDVVRGMAEIVGALPSEVAVMQTLTANLHLMMASFYKPTQERYKIILEGKAFPSDHVSTRFRSR